MENYSLILSAAVIAALLIDPATALFQNLLQSFNGQNLPFLKKPRVFGGNTAQPGEFPWMISIQQKPPADEKVEELEMRHQCGGAIIESTLIVTAGHCVLNTKASDMEVVAGAHNIKKNESSQQRRKLERIYLHPNFTDGESAAPFDIAIIQIKTPFTFNNHVDKIGVAECKESALGKDCYFAGWGNLFPVSTLYYQGSEELLSEKATIIPMKECEEVYAGLKDKLATAVCSRSGLFHGTCQGDSGGPLVCNRGRNADPYLAGVVSFGFPVCNDGYHPDVYSDLGNSNLCSYLSEYETFGKTP